jgi:hypothetical protein
MSTQANLVHTPTQSTYPCVQPKHPYHATLPSNLLAHSNLAHRDTPPKYGITLVSPPPWVCSWDSKLLLDILRSDNTTNFAFWVDWNTLEGKYNFFHSMIHSDRRWSHTLKCCLLREQLAKQNHTLIGCIRHRHGKMHMSPTVSTCMDHWLAS